MSMDLSFEILMEQNIYGLIAIVIAKIALYFVIIFYLERKNNYKNPLKMNVKIFLQVIALVGTVILIISSLTPIFKTSQGIPEEFSQNINFLLVCLAVLCILTVSIYDSIVKLSNEQMALKLLNQQRELQFAYAKDIDLSLSEMKSVRHDMANHISCIKGLLEYQEYDKLEDYVEKLSGPLESGSDIILTDHPAISSFIYSKIGKARKLDIHVDLKTDLQSSINIDDLDLSVLFGNILDNAIEACVKITKGERNIELSIQQQMGCFVIHCVNTMNEIIIDKKNNTFISNKSNKNRHGIGLKNINAIVEKYDGQLDINTNERLFNLKVVLFEK
jgi:sensor histidine kinase YesM